MTISRDLGDDSLPTTSHVSYTDIIVRGYHLDGYQHVNNARYLEFLEEARWGHFNRHLEEGVIAQNNWMFVIVNININYRYPAVVGDILRIETFMKEIKSRSAMAQQLIYRKSDGQAIADATVTFVLVDRATQRAIAIDDEVRSILYNPQQQR